MHFEINKNGFHGERDGLLRYLNTQTKLLGLAVNSSVQHMQLLCIHQTYIDCKLEVYFFFFYMGNREGDVCRE